VSTLIVLAKAPVPGRVKTRLCPPCTPQQAARIAEASLLDTVAAANRSGFERRVLALDGAPGPWLPRGWAVVPQVAGDLGRRLDGAFAAAEPPALLIGMDTPQLDAALLDRARSILLAGDCDGVLGPAFDGGYWAIGFSRRVHGAFHHVPMSTARTGAVQIRRLRALGLRTRMLTPLRDIDHFADALAVAGAVPASRLATAVGSVMDAAA
jgi:rSAM/selenodomain-associated transferase 1